MTVQELLNRVAQLKGEESAGCACVDLQVLSNEIDRLEYELARLDDMLDVKVDGRDYTRCRDCNRIFDMCDAEDWGYHGDKQGYVNLGYWTEDDCVCPDCEVKAMGEAK
jgi:uncharacterized small protein (DUF1192 family)